MDRETAGMITKTREISRRNAGKLITLLMLLATGTMATTTNVYFVDANSTDPQSPYNDPGTAAKHIQTAVDLAQADLVPGTTECTVLVADGTYTLTAPITLSKGITLRSVNGRDVTVIDGGYPASTNRCITITDCSANISGFTIRNGFAYGAAVDGQGGGIFATNTTGIIENCLIRKNRADRPTSGGYGGGMFIEGGSPIVRDCVIEGNDTMGVGSEVQGGTGIYINNSALFMYDCVVSNHVQVGFNGTGAGLYMFGSTGGIVSNCQFLANSCSGDGATFVYGGTMTHSLISNNYARSNAGGIYLYGNNTGSKLLYSRVVNNRAGGVSGGGVSINRGILDNCVILNNTASKDGGGIYNLEGTIKNCLIAGNEAGGSGGGLYRTLKPHVIRNCMIVQNKAGTHGGGVYNLSMTENNFLNCIITDNSATLTNDCYSIASSAIGYSCAPELPEGINGNTTNAPAFLYPGSGAGLDAVLGDYRLAGSSPCIDTGSNDVSVIATRDLSGELRVRPYGGRIDMGCYEASGGGPLSCQFSASPVIGVGPLSVAFTGLADGTNTVGATYRWIFGDGNTSDWSSERNIHHTYAARATAYSATLEVANADADTASCTLSNLVQAYPANVYVATTGAHISPFDSWATAATNLQAAIDAALGGYTAELIVSNGVYTAPAEIVVNKALPIRSVNGAAVTVLKGEGLTNPHRVIRFTTTAGGSGLDGFTVTNGYLASVIEGAGLNVERASVKGLLIQNCLIAGNVNANRSGGGMLLNYENAVVTNCQFIGNTQGGGSYRGGGLLVYRGLVVDCLFSNNLALTSYGGGIAATSYASTIRNCRVVNNRAARGGGIYNEIATIQNCLVAGNEATVYGGGVNFLSTARFSNCTVVGNTAGTAGGGVYQQGGLATNMIVAYNQLTAGAANDIEGTVTNFAFSCSPALVDGLNGNVTAAPIFENAGTGTGLSAVLGDYRLRFGSPCIDTGIYEGWMASAVDLQGEPRVQGSAPNMGAYEGVILPRATLIIVN